MPDDDISIYLGKPFYAAFNEDGCLAGHEEGAFIARTRRGLVSEMAMCRRDPRDYTIRRVTMVLEPDDA